MWIKLAWWRKRVWINILSSGGEYIYIDGWYQILSFSCYDIIIKIQLLNPEGLLHTIHIAFNRCLPRYSSYIATLRRTQNTIVLHIDIWSMEQFDPGSLIFKVRTAWNKYIFLTSSSYCNANKFSFLFLISINYLDSLDAVKLNRYTVVWSIIAAPHVKNIQFCQDTFFQ